MTAREVNFDGLVGPSHHYGGLSFGNIASEEHQGDISNPKQAALQGLGKMRELHQLGVPQALFPPHMRPELSLARRMGFLGSDAQVMQSLAEEQPLLLAACYSASAMWTANAATVSPSADSADGRVHFTPANLQNKIHRSIEAPTTTAILRAVFNDAERFAVHEALPSTAALGDEGAANHTRFAPAHGKPGLQLFVFGESSINPYNPKPKVFPARQTQEACAGLIKLHQLAPERVVLAQQNPEVIDQGVFHNDVISVGNLNLFFYHEEAFIDTQKTIDELRRKYLQLTGDELRLIEVSKDAVSVGTAVTTYLFNSQLLELPGGRIALVAPKECEEDKTVRDYVQSLIDAGKGIDEVHYFDLRQSMQGGGGPACLRLRVVLTEDEEKAIAQGVRFDDELDRQLVSWVEKHYRDGLKPADLADPQLIEESRRALDELTQLLGLGSIYAFQRS